MITVCFYKLISGLASTVLNSLKLVKIRQKHVGNVKYHIGYILQNGLIALRSHREVDTTLLSF